MTLRELTRPIRRMKRHMTNTKNKQKALILLVGVLIVAIACIYLFINPKKSVKDNVTNSLLPETTSIPKVSDTDRKIFNAIKEVLKNNKTITTGNFKQDKIYKQSDVIKILDGNKKVAAKIIEDKSTKKTFAVITTKNENIVNSIPETVIVDLSEDTNKKETIQEIQDSINEQPLETTTPSQAATEEPNPTSNSNSTTEPKPTEEPKPTTGATPEPNNKSVQIVDDLVPQSSNWLDAKIQQHKSEIDDKDESDFRAISGKLNQGYIQDLMADGLTQEEQGQLNKYLKNSLSTTEYERAKVLFNKYSYLLNE